MAPHIPKHKPSVTIDVGRGQSITVTRNDATIKTNTSSYYPSTVYTGEPQTTTSTIKTTPQTTKPIVNTPSPKEETPSSNNLEISFSSSDIDINGQAVDETSKKLKEVSNTNNNIVGWIKNIFNFDKDLDEEDMQNLQDSATALNNIDQDTKEIGETLDIIQGATGDSLSSKWEKTKEIISTNISNNSDIFYTYNQDDLARISATKTNLFFALGEGILDVGETIVDTAANLGSLYTYGSLMNDNSNPFINSTEKAINEQIGKNILNQTANFVATEYSDKAFDKLYETDVVLEINNLAYNPAKRSANGKNGIIYEGTKAVGYYLPIMAAGNISPIVGTTKIVGQSAAMWVTSYGKSAEKNLGNSIENNVENGDTISVYDYAKDSTKAFTTATIDAGIWGTAGRAKNVVKNIPDIDINGDIVSIQIKSLKPVLSATANTVLYGDEFDAEKVLIETAAVWIAEGAAVAAGKVFPEIKLLESNEKNGMDGIPNSAFQKVSDKYFYESIIKWTNNMAEDTIKRVAKEETAVLSKELLSSFSELLKNNGS